jgi:hypothetical protein
MTINDNERKVLEHLASDDECSFYFRSIVDTARGLDLKTVRRCCRSLARKGLAEFHRGLFDEDGMVAGSGYAITQDGKRFLFPCDVCGQYACYEYDGNKKCEAHYGKSIKSVIQPCFHE